MGKHHQDEAPQPTQEQVEGSVAAGIAAGLQPPQGQEELDKQSILGERVRVFSGGHMVTVELTDYHNGMYYGLAKRCFSMNTGEKPPIFEALEGLARYPDSRRDVIYQWVKPGEDENVLRNIATQGVIDRQPTEVVSD